MIMSSGRKRNVPLCFPIDFSLLLFPLSLTYSLTLTFAHFENITLASFKAINFSILWGANELCQKKKLGKTIRKENLMWHHEELRNDTDLCKTNVEEEREKKEVMLWAPKRKEKEMEIRLANLKITRKIIFILNHFDATHLHRFSIFLFTIHRKEAYFLAVLDSSQLKFIVLFFDKLFAEEKYRFWHRELFSESKVFIYF